MFVKVHVSYGDGERSSPQDLLLYDSQCWHCSLTGECNAKPNNKCVFSAGASNVQSFRIGKSISRTEGIVFFLSCNHPALTTQFAIIIQITFSEDFVCSLPHDSGGCDRKEFRYYYNSLEVKVINKLTTNKI